MTLHADMYEVIVGECERNNINLPIHSRHDSFIAFSPDIADDWRADESSVNQLSSWQVDCRRHLQLDWIIDSLFLAFIMMLLIQPDQGEFRWIMVLIICIVQYAAGFKL